MRPDVPRVSEFEEMSTMISTHNVSIDHNVPTADFCSDRLTVLSDYYSLSNSQNFRSEMIWRYPFM